jgi:hypothetical protein
LRKISHIFKGLKKGRRLSRINLDICRDFSGKEAQIKQNPNYFLVTRLGLKMELGFCKLPPGSMANDYAYLIRKDRANKFRQYLLPIKLDEFGAFLK